MEGQRKKQFKRDQETLEKFSKRLAELRHRAGLTQRQLAFEAVMTPDQIGRYEKAKANPTISALAALARALEVPIYELLKFPDESGS